MEHFIDQDGFALFRAILAADECAALCTAIGPIGGAGRRGLLAQPLVIELAHSRTLVDLVRPHVGGEPCPVRAIYFNKSPDANWLVAWHQDVTIAVRERKEVPGFGPWTVKNGIPHVQPPIDVLERMLAVRLHFDDTDEKNGALRVLPGSHRLGRLSPEQIGALRAERPEFICCAEAGDALLMRPLILHASSRSLSERERRVLHIEYSGQALPGGLDWHDVA